LEWILAAKTLMRVHCHAWWSVRALSKMSVLVVAHFGNPLMGCVRIRDQRVEKMYLIDLVDDVGLKKSLANQLENLYLCFELELFRGGSGRLGLRSFEREFADMVKGSEK
jgi:hypothetical protein